MRFSPMRLLAALLPAGGTYDAYRSAVLEEDLVTVVREVLADG